MNWHSFFNKEVSWLFIHLLNGIYITWNRFMKKPVGCRIKNGFIYRVGVISNKYRYFITQKTEHSHQFHWSLCKSKNVTMVGHGLLAYKQFWCIKSVTFGPSHIFRYHTSDMQAHCLYVPWNYFLENHKVILQNFWKNNCLVIPGLGDNWLRFHWSSKWRHIKWWMKLPLKFQF